MTPTEKALLEPRTAAGKEAVTRYWHLVDLREEVAAIEAESAAPLRAALLWALNDDTPDEKPEGMSTGEWDGIKARYRENVAKAEALLAANPPAATEERCQWQAATFTGEPNNYCTLPAGHTGYHSFRVPPAELRE